MQSFKRISVQDTKQLLETDESVQLIDIRDEASYQQGHITGATFIDNSVVQHYIQQADFAKPLVVYGYHGNSSQSAAAFFAEQGFEDVYSVDGGYEQWKTL